MLFKDSPFSDLCIKPFIHKSKKRQLQPVSGLKYSTSAPFLGIAYKAQGSWQPICIDRSWDLCRHTETETSRVDEQAQVTMFCQVKYPDDRGGDP